MIMFQATFPDVLAAVANKKIHKWVMETMEKLDKPVFCDY